MFKYLSSLSLASFSLVPNYLNIENLSIPTSSSNDPELIVSPVCLDSSSELTSLFAPLPEVSIESGSCVDVIPASKGVHGEHRRKGDKIYCEWYCLTRDGSQMVPLEAAWKWNSGALNRIERRYKTMNHDYTDKYLAARFVGQDPYLDNLDSVASKLRSLSRENNLNLLDVVLSFVQSLPHQDNSTQKYAVETLIDLQGDCSDKTVLLAGLFRKLNFSFVVVDFPQHVALAVSTSNGEGKWYRRNGVKYYLCETNAGLQSVGYIMSSMRNENYRIWSDSMGYIRLWEDIDFSGDSITLDFDEDVFNLKDVKVSGTKRDLNDRVSSIEFIVPAGMEINFFKHKGYNAYLFSISGDGEISSIHGKGAKDCITSIRWD